MNDLAALLPLVAILALFWFMVIRPQQRRQKEVVALQNSIQVGQRVMMSSGVFGTVTSIADDRARLEIAPGTEIEIARAAIAKVDESGLDRLDRGVLDVLCRRFGGGPVGISTLAVAVGEERETVEEVAEPFLVRSGLLARTPRGRVATPAAWQHLGLTPPAVPTVDSTLFEDP